MRTTSTALLSTVLLVLGAGAAPAVTAPAAAEAGFVVYVGHLGGAGGCAVDRRLAARLRAETRGVPIGRVLAAPGCVALKTARLAFGRATVTRSLASGQGLARALRARPRTGTNTVVVGSPASVVRLGAPRPARGEALVFEGGEFVVRLRPHGWSAFLATRPDARFREWDVASPSQVHPHDIWPAGDGTVWYTAQFRGAAGRLDTRTGAFREIALGAGSSPHGVVADADGNAWITDQGLDAIVRVDRETEVVTAYSIPAPDANPNTAAFDRHGVLWFTGASGFYGRLDPASGRVEAWPAARGGGIAAASGPYGITATPDGMVWFVSLNGGYLGRVDPASGALTVIDPPTRNSGPRRVWSDSRGRLWITESFASKLAMYDPATARWREWLMPAVGSGDRTGHPYAVCVDRQDKVWLTDFSTNTLQRFDPVTERFEAFPLPTTDALVRQIVEVDGTIWGAESATEKLIAVAVAG